MGAELTCTLRLGKKKAQIGKALLETDYLLFRGEERVRIPFSDVKGVEAKGGVLHLSLAGGTAALALGPAAAKWAEKIARPKGIVEKLGVKDGSRVALIGAFDEGFRGELDAAGARVARGSKAKPGGHDHVLFATEKASELARVGDLARLATPAGGVWIVYPKGRKDIREADVLAAGRAAGLKDVKVARFSETHTALRFVVPLANRRG